MKVNRTLVEAIADWEAGRTVWSAELGGLGPGYEQAIQILLWELLSRWNGNQLKDGEEYSKEYNDFVDSVVHDLNRFGFSGAQVGAAKNTAFQFLLFGYDKQMEKLDDDRWIQVERAFPTL